MSDWGEVIRGLREARGLTQFDLADKSGLSRQKISLIELGRVKTYDDETLIALSAALEIPKTELRLRLHGEYNKDGLLPGNFSKINILGIVPAGTPAENEQQHLGSIYVDSNLLGNIKSDDIFGLRVSGNSLIGDGIENGGTVIIEKHPKIIDGKIYIVRIGSETVARHLFRKNGTVVLTSSNGAYQELRFNEVEVLGRVIKFYPKEIDL